MTVKTMGRIDFVARKPLGQPLAEWIHRYRTRRDLLRLDAHLLADIGVTRADVEREAAKPFWQA